MLDEFVSLGLWVALDKTICRGEQCRDRVEIAVHLCTNFVWLIREFVPVLVWRAIAGCEVPEVPEQGFYAGAGQNHFFSLEESSDETIDNLCLASLDCGCRTCSFKKTHQ